MNIEFLPGVFVVWASTVFAPFDGNHYRTTKSFGVVVMTLPGVFFEVQIPQDYVFDGASIPAVFWLIVGTPFDPEVIRAACVHDWLCDHVESYQERVVGDSAFFKLLKDDGVPYWRRALMYLAVRTYARFWWSWRGAK